MKNSPLINAVDLFCGAGGLSHGLVSSGVNVCAGYDIDERCRYAFEYNNNANFYLKDINDVTASEVCQHLKINSGFSLLAGCAPCQPFSSYSRKNGKKDGRWNLLGAFSKLVQEALPDFVTMENVPGLVKEDIFKNFLDDLDSSGYFVSYRVLFGPDYGLPQTRRRLVLVASRLSPIKIIDATHQAENYVTVRDTIAHLTSLNAGEKDLIDPLHRSSKLSEINLERIRTSKPGGSWLDWPEELRASCHLKETGVYYSSVYGRMEWDAPAPTITTQCNGYGNGRFGHPEQDRAITLREAALLQTFPEYYKFTENDKNGITNIARMIGNAVPVRLGEIVARSIFDSI